MRREEIISAIKQAEGNARAMVESARASSERQIAEARREAERMVADAGAAATRQADAAVEKARSEIRGECDSLLQGGLKDIELCREKARNRIPRARELLLKGFEGAFRA